MVGWLFYNAGPFVLQRQKLPDMLFEQTCFKHHRFNCTVQRNDGVFFFTAVLKCSVETRWLHATEEVFRQVCADLVRECHSRECRIVKWLIQSLPAVKYVFSSSLLHRCICSKTGWCSLILFVSEIVQINSNRKIKTVILACGAVL